MEQMEHSDSIANLAAALSRFQADVPSVTFDSVNPFLKNKYASLGAMIETARPVLAENGLAVSHIVVSYDGMVGVETILLHSSGEFISNIATLPAADEKGKSGAQVAGSIVTYLRRYGYAAVLGLYAEEDTDGNQSQPRPEQNAKQGSQKSPQGQKPASQAEVTAPTPRPYAPEALQEVTAKYLSTKEQVFCTEEEAKKLAIMWKNILHHDDQTREAVASFILSRNIDSFKEMTSAEIESLKLWLHNNPQAARSEAEAIVKLFGEQKAA
jgi:ERF superfamily